MRQDTQRERDETKSSCAILSLPLARSTRSPWWKKLDGRGSRRDWLLPRAWTETTSPGLGGEVRVGGRGSGQRLWEGGC
jgi:hypothetical protein